MGLKELFKEKTDRNIYEQTQRNFLPCIFDVENLSIIET